MADTFKLTTVTNSIKAQSITVTDVSGASVTLTIKDVDNMLFVVSQQNCPILQPRFDDFVIPIGDFFTRDSFGADASVKSVRYTLHYKFFFAPVLQGEILGHYSDSVAALVAVLLYFMKNTNLSGATEFLPRLESFQPQLDGNNTKFHGGQIAFDVTQYLET